MGASSGASTPLTGSPPREVTKKLMSGAPSPLRWRVVARTPPTFTSTCSFTSPASKSTATTGSWSTSKLSTTPTTGTTRRLLLLILTGPLAMSPRRRLSPGLSGSVNNKAISADGYGYGHGYRQHHWGNGGKGFGEHGLPNLASALAWEGHAGLHFFTRFPKGVVNPFIYSLPEGFTIE